ncbi:chemotaxis protein CheB [Roseospirillum parvum]|nr:chemotaxis protein CheB [Roseospirillum parvum]
MIPPVAGDAADSSLSPPPDHSSAPPPDHSPTPPPDHSPTPPPDPPDDDRLAAETTDDLGTPIHVVGIGASAGGLEALSRFLSALGPDLPVCCIVAQHLSPTHHSHLVNLLQRETDLPVLEASDHRVLEAGRVFVCPANRDISVVGNTIRLVEPARSLGPKPSVNALLASIARTFGRRAIAVILSGTGSDGAHGVRAVRAAGGLVLAQSPDNAKYDGMPRAAIETGLVDLILPAERIARELPRLLQRQRQIVSQEMVPEELAAVERLVRCLRKRSGVNFGRYKRAMVLRRARRRMQTLEVFDFPAYVDVVESTPHEADLLFRDMLLSAGGFFHDADAFGGLAVEIRKLVENRDPGQGVRAWVPGCASGEEAYAIAMLVHRAIRLSASDAQVQVFGTDINADMIAIARQATYALASAASLPVELADDYLHRQGENVLVAKPVRDCVIFARHDLIEDPPFLRLDLVSCRNTLVYFEPDLQRQLLEMLHFALAPGGLLFLGRSESVAAANDLFEPVDTRLRIFRRRVLPQGRQPEIPPAVRLPSGESEPVVERRSRPGDVLSQSLLETFAPPSVIVDERLEVLHVFGDVSPFLSPYAGAAGLNVVRLAGETLRPTLRAGLSKLFRDGAPVEISGLKGRAGNGFRILMRPIGAGPTRHPHAVISFLGETRPVVLAPGGEAGEALSLRGQVAQLESDLETSQENLKAVVSELETSNEELLSLNEELQASNEELHSTNEELETANEELQSTNEELITVNEELLGKSEELAAAQSDLDNIQSTIGLAFLLIDPDLRIRRLNAQAGELFGLDEDALGQVLGQVLGQATQDDLGGRLIDRLSRVIAGGPRDQFTQVLHGREVMVQLYPYLDPSGRPVGAVVTGLDRSEVAILRRHLNQERETLARTQRLEGLLLDLIAVPVAVFAPDARLVEWNRAFARRMDGPVAAGMACPQVLGCEDCAQGGAADGGCLLAHPERWAGVEWTEMESRRGRVEIRRVGASGAPPEHFLVRFLDLDG